MRVGIAGAGFMSRTHAEMDVEIVAVVSPSGPEPFVDALDLVAVPYTDVSELCERGAIDFLDICTPTHTHANTVRTAADLGIDDSAKLLGLFPSMVVMLTGWGKTQVPSAAGEPYESEEKLGRAGSPLAHSDWTASTTASCPFAATSCFTASRIGAS